MKVRQTERATEFVRSLYSNRKRARQLLSQLKSDYEYHDLPKVLRSMLQTHRSFAHYVFATPFPKQCSDFRKPQSQIPYIDIQREVRWATAILSVFPQELEKFIAIRQRFETGFLLGNYHEADTALEEC